MAGEKAAVLFSGGVDSSFAAVTIAPEFRKVVLLTYLVPGMTSVDNSRRNAATLAKMFPGSVSHEIHDLRGFVNEVRGGIIDCVKNNYKYGFFYSWCLGCKLSMHLHTIEYCLRNDIQDVFDGNNIYDRHALEQHEEVIERLRSLYEKEGMRYSSPFYRHDHIEL
ncbi:MAG: hypothetical protein V2B18_05040, partial [Pseudomonadota bacterium]